MDIIPLQNEDAGNKYKKPQKNILLLVRGKFLKIGLSGEEKNIFIASLSTIYTGREEKSCTEREETSTEQKIINTALTRYFCTVVGRFVLCSTMHSSFKEKSVSINL